MGCRVRVNRHGFLAFRLYWQGREFHQGTKLRDTPVNRAKVEARARVITQEMRDGVFDYERWFPGANIPPTPIADAPTTRRATLRAFFESWGGTKDAERQIKPVTIKWARNRASAIRAHVLPLLGDRGLHTLTVADLAGLQRAILKTNKPATVDNVVHSALRGMLRDAQRAGYETADLAELYNRESVPRQDRGSDREIDPFTAAERDAILDAFRTKRPRFFAFVFHQFWTGTRPSEAIALRYQHVDLKARHIRIRASWVGGAEGRPKTGKSKRTVEMHANLAAVLRAHLPLRCAPDAFVFTSSEGHPIIEDNFYRREWLAILRLLGIRPRAFYQTRHTYISHMIEEVGARPLYVARQTGTSLAMIDDHYGRARITAADVDRRIEEAMNRNLAGTLEAGDAADPSGTPKNPQRISAVMGRAGGRDRTDDVQLGKLKRGGRRGGPK